ncbi:DNA cytosine methyltransferase [Candidatus Shapirobacteria bacterium]|nr:DNA cytosine methyltransferase [Candidatus Shapirobacteria bacterium]
MEAKFTFVDLFAGIGGFRMALQRCSGECLGFSEIDKNAIATYENNFIDSVFEWNLGDITRVGKLQSQVDMLVGGVPCQSWSVAGKKLGFDDPRGKLWHDAIRLVEINRPKVFIFENVKGLADPRNKRNLLLIVSELEKAGYSVAKPQLLNSYDFGLPQNRERIFIVGFRNDVKLKVPFSYPKPMGTTPRLYSFLDGVKKSEFKKSKVDPKVLFDGKIPFSRNKFQKSDELNDFFIFCDTRNGHSTIHSWDLIETSEKEKNIGMTFLKNRRKKIYGNKDGNPMSFDDLKRLIPDLTHSDLTGLVEKKIIRIVGDKFDLVNSKNSSGINGIYRIFLPDSNIFSTLTATGTRDHVATETVTGENPKEFKSLFIKNIYNAGKYRMLTPSEAGLLQGFVGFKPHPSASVAMKQFGNAVSVNVVENLMLSVLKTGIFEK